MSGTTYSVAYPIDPSSGSTVLSAFINNAGEVVGTYFDSSFNTHGFTDVGGVITTIDDGTNPTTDVTAVNNGGSFVGYGVDAAGNTVAWFVTNSAGVQTTFADPAGVQVTPVAINAGGTVVGEYNSAGFIGNAASGVVSVISVAGAETTTISAINAGGTVVGDYYDASDVQHGFIDAAGLVTTVDPTGSTQTTINAVNTAGTVAGTFLGADGNTSGFTDTAGVISSFTVSGNEGLVVTAINDPGTVAGYYLNGNTFDYEGFTESAGVVSSFSIAGSPDTEILGINNGGTLVGVADDTNYNEHAFTATPACYCLDTAIATPAGPVAVQALSIGDLVCTASGEARPVKWIGRRSYANRFLAGNPALQPVRFHAGSLGHGLPTRDLLVSPAHAMFLDGVLIPAHCLVNGQSITQERAFGQLDYFHIELETHDVILAEGAPSESFLDDDSRFIFHNATEFARLYPEAPQHGKRYCAPRVEHGWAVEAVRQRLAVIAGAMTEAA